MAAAAAAAGRTILVLGASGKTGRRVCELALARSWRVAAFVRNAERLPIALRAHERVTVVVGNLNTAADVADAVRSARADAVVDASSALPFGHDKGAAPNDADRSVLLHAVVDTLAAEGRLADCAFIIVGGQLVPEPGGTINTLFARVLEWLLRVVVAPRQWAAVARTIEWLWASPPELRFTMLRMGQMEEAASHGTLRPESTEGREAYPRGAVAYDDVAACIVALAEDERRPGPWSRRAVYLNYEREVD